MDHWKTITCVLLLAAQSAFAQISLVKFEDGQVASASAVNQNFKQLQVQITKQQRPAFRSNPLFPRKIDIPAGTGQLGQVVAIGDKVMVFSQTIQIDLDVSGQRGGLDTGTVQPSTIYYVYVVEELPPSTLPVAAVASTNPPSLRPPPAPPPGPSPAIGVGSQWSYLGSFTTNTSANVVAFSFSKGRYLRWGGSQLTTSSTSPVLIQLPVPLHATEVHGRFGLSNAGAAGDVVEAGPDTGSILTIINSATSAPGQTLFGFASVPLLNGPLIYLRVTSVTTVGGFEPLGWTEDPTMFQ